MGSEHEVVVRVVGDVASGSGGQPPRRRWSFRGMGIVAGLGAVAVAVILLSNAIGGIFNVSLFGTTKIDRSAPVVLKQLRNVSTYTAATGEFEATIDVEDDVELRAVVHRRRAHDLRRGRLRRCARSTSATSVRTR